MNVNRWVVWSSTLAYVSSIFFSLMCMEKDVIETYRTALKQSLEHTIPLACTPARYLDSVAVNPAGSFLAWVEKKSQGDYVAIWSNYNDFKTVSLSDCGAMPQLFFDGDELLALIEDVHRNVHIDSFCLNTGQRITTRAYGAGWVHQAVFNRQKRRLVVYMSAIIGKQASCERVEAINMNTHAIDGKVSGTIREIQISPPGNLVALALEKSIAFWSLPPKKGRELPRLENPLIYDNRAMMFAGEGSALVVLSGACITIWEISNLHDIRLQSLMLGPLITKSMYMYQGSSIARTASDNIMHVARNIQKEKGNAAHVSILTLSDTHGNKITSLDMPTSIEGSGVHAIIANDTGSKVVIILENGMIFVCDAKKLQEVALLPKGQLGV